MSRHSDKQAEEIFHALHSLDQLNARGVTPAMRYSFQELYAYANNCAHQPSPALQKALSNDLKARKDLNRLIRAQNIAVMDRAAAASSGDIDRREGEGFTLTLTPSKADASQVYLIIESEMRDDSPTLLFVLEENGPVHRLPIDDFEEGEAQILLQVEQDIVKGLRNPKSDVILR